MGSDDPLSIFLPEAQKTNGGAADSVVLRKDEIQGRELSAQFAISKTNSANDHTTVLVNHLKRALGALDVARDLTKAVDNRFAALKTLEQEVRDRADALESLKQRILEGTAHADDVVRLITSLEPRLADLREREHDLRAVETSVAAFEERAQTVTAALDRHVGVCEAREERVVQAVEQLGLRAADTIADLDRRVGDCQAQAHTAQETIAHLDEVSTRTLPELQERLKEADKKHQFIDQKIAEAVQIAAAMGALEQRLPRVGQCDQELARIELVVPQVERQLEDLNEAIAQQIRALAVNQQHLHRTRDESQKSAAVVSELENRIADLSRSHQQLDGVEQRVGQLEARAATAASEFTQATRAKNDLEQEVTALQTQIRRITEAADDEAKKFVEFTEQAKRSQHEQAQQASAVLSALETRMADVTSGHQLLDRVEQQLGQLEARAVAAAIDVKQATGTKNGLEQEVVALQNQLRRMTEAGDDEAKKLVEFTEQAKRSQHEQAQRASAVLSALETRMADVTSGHQLLDRVEQQLEQLEARAAAAATEVKQAAGAKNGLEQGVAALQNQLQQMTKAADDEAKKLVDLKQQTERYRREETQTVSAVLSKLETRMADIGRSRRQLASVDKHVAHLEQRAAAAATAVKQATGAKNAFQREIAELHDQLQELTKVAHEEANTLAELKQQAKRRRLYRASYAYAVDRSIAQQLRRRASRAWRSLTPGRLMAGGVVVALSVAVVVLVGIAWRFGRTDNDSTAIPPPPPLLASRRLEFTPIEAVAPLASAPVRRSSPQGLRWRRTETRQLACRSGRSGAREICLNSWERSSSNPSRRAPQPLSISSRSA